MMTNFSNGYLKLILQMLIHANMHCINISEICSDQLNMNFNYLNVSKTVSCFGIICDSQGRQDYNNPKKMGCLGTPGPPAPLPGDRKRFGYFMLIINYSF